ncbi:UPF0271 protein [Formosa sp. Hel1_31_208]|uniref:5-oxoprolinase subunit PxpA n=1 Tax=Formosa sp. Hel1_31_208 TaxID=1798225 RepID=UPI00087DC6BB|nr:5-oxoprolinase subunit PxpA [Formosa sp. Hel1_31_208]SDS49399.1 UPF0271 protein [Formosa sp. Hel1_31_208]
MIKIDINCDLGEGIGNEAALMPLLSSCNIACGGHAGDISTMKAVVELAQDYGVKIGAHPSFPDRVHFGRQVVKMSSKALSESLFGQINSLKLILDRKQLPLNHIKPHGALYNLAVIDKNMALIVIEVVKRFGDDVVLYAPYQSIIAELAISKGLKVKFEAFADRNYNEDLTLVSRHQERALIHDSEAMFQHVYQMILNGKVRTLNGVELTLKAETFCVHGDHEKVVRNLKDVIAKLKQHNIEIS